jgi:hypothetical protein
VDFAEDPEGTFPGGRPHSLLSDLQSFFRKPIMLDDHFFAKRLIIP